MLGSIWEKFYFSYLFKKSFLSKLAIKQANFNYYKALIDGFSNSFINSYTLNYSLTPYTYAGIATFKLSYNVTNSLVKSFKFLQIKG